jgi:hypothetical protein
MTNQDMQNQIDQLSGEVIGLQMCINALLIAFSQSNPQGTDVVRAKLQTMHDAFCPTLDPKHQPGFGLVVKSVLSFAESA